MNKQLFTEYDLTRFSGVYQMEEQSITITADKELYMMFPCRYGAGLSQMLHMVKASPGLVSFKPLFVDESIAFPLAGDGAAERLVFTDSYGRQFHFTKHE